MTVVGKLVTSPRGATYYWMERNADPHAPCIVFTHGIVVDHHLFDKQMPYFIKNYTVITWDLPMHGRSKPYEDFTYVHAAQELEAIIQREKLQKIILVGAGIGGYVCQEYTSMHPEQVQAFIGIGVMPYGDAYYTEAEMRQMRHAPIFLKYLPERMIYTRLAHARGQSRYGYQNSLRMIEQVPKKDIIRIFTAAYQDRFTHRDVVNFTCPVLLVVGALDYEGEFAEYCRKWAEKSGYPMYVIQDAAHNANADDYDTFNDVLGKFLRRNLK